VLLVPSPTLGPERRSLLRLVTPLPWATGSSLSLAAGPGSQYQRQPTRAQIRLGAGAVAAALQNRQGRIVRIGRGNLPAQAPLAPAAVLST
jgi:hypothetical protein